MTRKGVTFIRKILFYFSLLGLDLKKILTSIKELPAYLKDIREIRKQQGDNPDFRLGKYYPVFGDRYSRAGTAKGHYFHQDLLVAQKIFEHQPEKHVDIGSRIDGFVAHVAVFRKIEVFDIRPLQSVGNIIFKQADLTEIPAGLENYTDSVSSLHAIEHFGLGRYGDHIDYQGHVKAIDNIFKILKTGGKFYFSVPIGPQRIEFNAHRVFEISYLIRLLKDRFKIDSFSYVDDNEELHYDVALDKDEIDNNFGCNYGCGIFEMTKM